MVYQIIFLLPLMKNQSDNAKFEQISPVLELIYLMVTNMQKYLRVYAEDTQAETLKEYKETHEALQNLRRVLDRIYGIEDAPQNRQNAPKTEERTPVVSNSANVKKEIEDAFQSFAGPSTNDFAQPAQPPMPQMQPQQPPMPQHMSVPNPQMDEFVLPSPMAQQPPMQQMQAPQPPMGFQQQQPMQPPMPQMQPQQQVQQPQVQSSQPSEIDSILAELRKLQANNRTE